MKHKFSFIELILGIVLIALAVQEDVLENLINKVFGNFLNNEVVISQNIIFIVVILGAIMIMNSFKTSVIFFETPSFLRGLTALICDAFFTMFFIFETDVSSVLKVAIGLTSLIIYFGVASYKRSFIPLIIITASLIALFVMC